MAKHALSRRFKSGGYTLVLSLIVTLLVVAINLLAFFLPTSLTRHDTTTTKLYTLSTQTEQITSALEEDIIIYHVAQKNNIDGTISEILQRYAHSSPHLLVEELDPVLYPKALEQYTTAALSENSLIVVAGKRFTLIDAAQIYVYDTTAMSAEGTYDVYLDLENALTGAIDYVTSDALPTVYLLSGHGELSLSDTLATAIRRENLLTQTLSLLALDAVPEDAAAVFIYAPQTDITQAETEILLAYANAGGKLLLITDYTQEALPNLATLCEAFGTASAQGILCEGDANSSLRGYAHYLLPQIHPHEITNPLLDEHLYVVFPLAHGITTLDAYRASLVIMPLLTTTDNAYLKVNAASAQTLSKEPGDIEGAYTLALAVTEDIGDVQSRFVWFSTAQFLLADTDNLVGGANVNLFLNALNFLCERENSIAIRAKQITADFLVIPSATANWLSFVVCVALPLLFLGAGMVVTLRRRKRS